MTNRSRTLYTGVTSDLEGRVAEHKAKIDPRSFTAQYNINVLVHAEEFVNANEAIAREKQIKGWSRKKKIDLIMGSNPEWKDLLKE